MMNAMTTPEPSERRARLRTPPQRIERVLVDTSRDVLAVSALLVGFQLFVLRRPIPHARRLLVGLAFVVIGLAFFLMGLELALFPLGTLMATQLSSAEFVGRDG